MVDTSTYSICRISPMYRRTPVIARKGRQSTERVGNGRGSVLGYSSVICFCHSRLIPTSFTQIHFSAQQRMKPNNYILNVYSLKYASVYLFLNNACTHYRYYANPTSKCVAYVQPQTLLLFCVHICTLYVCKCVIVFILILWLSTL